jgi:hypothetical protein
VNADVEKAVSIMDAAIELTEPQHTVFAADKQRWQTIRQALRDQEAEIARQYECIRSHGLVTRKAEGRAEQADALLRDLSRYVDPRQYPEAVARINAHFAGAPTANHQPHEPKDC